ncbi:hypothetical protein BDF19DRAFT_436649 [Syncephalis fuscata]|nr:hypothetical protein BDF19DRAFT_436649 [Syncephalis fuscata]
MAMPKQPEVLIIGAGVIGLTTALFLLEQGYRVSLVGEHLPGEYHPDYTSPWAGAHWRTMAHSEDLLQREMDTYTLEKLTQLEAEVGRDAGIMFVDNEDNYSDISQQGAIPWFRTIVKNFRVLEKHELLPQYQIGYAYQTSKWIFGIFYYDGHFFINNVARVSNNKYTHLFGWLQRQIEQRGGTLYRARLANWSDILRVVPTTNYSTPRVVINCSGNGAHTLGGVQDPNCYPTRGQTVLVRRPGFRKAITLVGADIFNYVIPRNDGIVVLGGTYQSYNCDPNPDPKIASKIMEHAVSRLPDLVDPKTGKLDVVKHAVGMRTTRVGGIRIEAEKKEINGRSILLLHNYGHGGQGYQSSWGSAKKVHELLEINLTANSYSRSVAKL